jgi:predicted RNA-binding protein
MFVTPQYEIFEKNCRPLFKKWKEAQNISQILRELKTEVVYPNLMLKSMSKMLAYLGLVESLGVKMMDMALLLLIANGEELHTRGAYAKHVKTFEELEDVWDLDYKLKFLDSAEISIFREKIMNKTLRDKIAHLNFKIENDGTIRDQGNNEIHIDDEISKFWQGIDILQVALEDLDFLIWLEERSSKSHE